MIPELNILTQEITEVTYPSRTYKIKFGGGDDSTQDGIVDVAGVDRISDYTDGLEALTQAIYLILSTERYEFIIYSWDYGIELIDLYGKPMPYVMAELPRRIKDALTQDDRISDVVDFEFETSGKTLTVSFTVKSNIGNIATELEVDV